MCMMAGLCYGPDNLHRDPARHLNFNINKAKTTPHHVQVTNTRTIQDDRFGSPQCTFCKDTIDQFEKVLLSDELRKDVDYITETVFCDLMPGDLKRICKEEVSSFTGIIFSIFKSTINSSNICRMTGLCPGPSPLPAGLSAYLNAPAKAFIMILRPILPLLEKVTMDKQTPVLEHVSVVITEKYPHLRPIANTTNNAACNVCRKVMHLVKQLLDDKDFRRDVEDMSVDLICPLLPKSFQGMCQKEIVMFASMFFDLADRQMDESAACEMLGMCEDNGHLHHYVQQRLAALRTSLNAVAKQWLPVLTQLEAIKEEQGECTICEIVIKQMLKSLKNGASDDKMIAVGKTYCNILPEPLAAQCKSFVEDNVVQIVNMLVKKLSPKGVCTAVGMCGHKQDKKEAESLPKDLITILKEASRTKKETKSIDEELPVLKVESGRRSPWCAMCLTITASINGFMGSKELLRAAVSLGDSVCALMPTTLKYTCDGFVREGFDLMFGDVSSFATPDFICGVVGICYVEFTPVNYTRSEFLHPTFKIVP